MFQFVGLSILTLYAASVDARWEQCGGIGWTGSTTCVSPLVCTELNIYYSQCLDAASVASSSSAKASSTTVKSSSSSIKSSSTSVKSSSTSVKPSSTSSKKASSTLSSTSSAITSTASVAAVGNPYTGKSVWSSSYYASEVNAAAALVTDTALKAKILKVASIPTFTWIETFAKVANIPDYLTAAGSSILQLVVYDLPDKDCHATTAISHGEYTYANNGAVLYQQFIDSIVTAVKASPSSTVVAVVEPKSLVNLITNLSDTRCASAAPQYRTSIIYACKALTSAGIYVYLDGGNAFLGWPANLAPAATLFTSVYTSSGSSPYFRGLATNVGGYDPLNGTPDPLSSGNPNYDESHYISSLGAQIVSAGWNAHFVVDQGRAGVFVSSTTTCNLKGAGIGARPTTSTNNSFIDAVVWVKPPGESDGASGQGSPNYDAGCAGSGSKVPSPEAGQWFQAHFFDLVNFANPSL